MHEGKVFHSLFKANGFTQESIGKQMGVSRQTIIDWIKMRELPTGRRQEIEKLFNVKFTDVKGMLNIQSLDYPKNEAEELLISYGKRISDLEEEMRLVKNKLLKMD